MSHHQNSHFATSHQELSLYAYISAQRQPQLFKILSGITGMAPESFFNHHLVFKPRQPKISPSAADLFYIQLVSRVPADDTHEYKPREQGWSMRLNDIPEVTRKPVVSRAVYSANTGAGDAIEFVKELGYTLQTPYFTENDRFIHSNVIITLSRTYTPSPPTTAAEPPAGDKAFGSPFPRDALKLVDPSGGWVLQAAVRVGSNTDVENINVGVAELRALKESLKGVCDVDVVERLALDTRVR